MRTFFTALAFFVMLWAVMPAIRRSIYRSPPGGEPDDDESPS